MPKVIETLPAAPPPESRRDNNDLVAALTAAIIAATRDVRAPDQAAIAAARQYCEIKSALRTHGEPIGQACTSVPVIL